jgi:threonine dehydrogenase-like Zn-dependent dehydrogenase
MRAPFQQGDFPAPVKYGYSNVGRVVGGDPALAGRTVFSLFPHQTRFAIPASAVTLVPQDVPPGRAVLAANLETAVNALWDARPGIGDRIAIVGAGTVGCLCAWLAGRIAGTDVELIDIEPARGTCAERLGVRFSTPAAAAADADLVIHASGSAAGLDTAIALAGFEATVLELSWYGTRRVEVGLGGPFHSRRLTLRASQVGHVATAQRARWTHARRMGLVMQLLASAELDTLITGESRFDDLPDVLATLADAPGSAICHRIAYL